MHYFTIDITLMAKVEAFDHLQGIKGGWDFGEVAQILGDEGINIGRNRLFDLARGQEVPEDNSKNAPMIAVAVADQSSLTYIALSNQRTRILQLTLRGKRDP